MADRGGRGTTLIVFTVGEGVVMVADDLVYKLENGIAVPAERNVRKIFAMGSVLIGTAGMMRSVQTAQIGADGAVSQTVSIEYKFEDWIVEFIRTHRGTPLSDPKAIADALHAKMRETFKPVEIFLEHGCWDGQSPGDRLVTYVVAGYTKNFKDFHLFEMGAEYGTEGDDLRYLAPFRHQHEFPHEFYLGEDKFLTMAVRGAEPQGATFRDLASLVRGRVSQVLPKIPEALQDLAALAVSLVKVEAKFNPNKVGQTVKMAVIDRLAGKQHIAVF
jgi:hypothetical protein